MSIEENIKKLNINYLKQSTCWIICCYKNSGKLLYISGQISIDENGELIKGKVGKDLIQKRL